MPDLTGSTFDYLHAIYDRHIGPVLVALVVGYIAIRVARVFVHGIVKTLMDREAREGTARELTAIEVAKRIQTIESLAVGVAQFFVIAIVGLWILEKAASVDIGPAIAGLGVVGVALGFGAQSLVRDYLNGALILIENHFSIGDVVRIAEVSGTVEDFSLRRTTLRNRDGNVYIVPNGLVGVTTNLTRVWARMSQQVSVAAGTDIDRVTEVADEVGRRLAADPDWATRILEAPQVERIEAAGENGITLWIRGTVRAPDRWAAAGELRNRVLAAFRTEGIEIQEPPLAHTRKPASGAGGAIDRGDAAISTEAHPAEGPE
jgi:moderate conductance mechanosensitive channel